MEKREGAERRADTALDPQQACGARARQLAERALAIIGTPARYADIPVDGARRAAELVLELLQSRDRMSHVKQ